LTAQSTYSEENMADSIKSYRDLIVWQKGIDLVTEVYKLTRKFPSYEVYALVNQLQRSAVSIPSNIAEGQARQHTGEFRQFLYVALGSAAEVDTQIVIAHRLGYITQVEADALAARIVEMQKMLHALIAKLPA
jgi:four helix bundle protein